MQRLRSIQALRAAAALAVVFYHACQWADAPFFIGAAGVDTFFVISGFVMWLAVQAPDLTPRRFLVQRFWRIAPAYWIASVLIVAGLIAAPKLLPHVYIAPWHAILSLLFIQHYDPAGLPFPVLPVGWSLNYEAIFYAILTLSLFAPRRIRFRCVAWGLVGVMIGGVLVVRPAYLLFANPMMLQFLAGAALGRAYLRRSLPRRGAGWGLMIGALLIFALLSPFDLYDSIWRPFLWGAPATLLVAGAASLESEGKGLRLPLFERLGEASYAIYLCHWPIVVALACGLGVARPWLFVPLAAGVAIAAGLAFWAGVERPFHRLGRRLAARPISAAAPTPLGSAASS